jgi:hypothetical protein
VREKGVLRSIDGHNTGPIHGSVMVCTNVGALEPQAFEASTLNPQEPEPAVPLNDKPVVVKLPENAPVAFNT